MTAQIPERLHYQGQQLPMCTEPLEDFFNFAGLSPEPGRTTSTALWRGYIGEWEIIDDRLYLIRIHGTLDGVKVSLETFFPSYPDRAFAHWFSGTIRSPQGNLLKYVHGGYGSICERDLLVGVERGIVREKKVRENEASETFHTGDPFPWIALKKFRVQQDDLLREMTVSEIEEAERFVDPLGGVPDLPFGHLYPKWELFRTKQNADHVLWSFSARWPRREYGRHLGGYVSVTDGAIGPHFLCAPIA